MVSGALTGVERIKHAYKRKKKRKNPFHTAALGIDLRRYPHPSISRFFDGMASRKGKCLFTKI